MPTDTNKLVAAQLASAALMSNALNRVAAEGNRVSSALSGLRTVQAADPDNVLGLYETFLEKLEAQELAAQG